MTFRVVKTIKGRKYLYEQTSVREGNKVRSICRYLGPVDGRITSDASRSEGSASKSDSGRKSAETPKATALHPQQRASSESGRGTSPESGENRERDRVVITAQKPGALPSGKPPLRSSEPNPTPVSVRFSLAEHKISARTLERHHQGARKMLSGMGVDPEALPPFIVRHGRNTTHQKRYRDGAYIITLPKRSHGHRTRFRREYRQALSRAVLDTIALQRPEAYARLALEFDRSFRDTQKALSSYMAVANTSNFAKILALKWFGVLNKPREVLPDPQKIGLVDYSTRKTWRDELVTIMTQIQQQGYGHICEQQKSEERLALKELRTAQTMFSKHIPLSPKWWRAKHRCKRALARHSAQKAFGVKLHVLGHILSPEGRVS